MRTIDFPLELKDVGEDGVIEGIAAAYGNLDLGGDIILPGAFTKTLRGRKTLPMLMYHDSRRPVGVWNDFEDSARGLKLNGTLTMLPNGDASAIALSQPAFQGSRFRFWIAEIDGMTGAIIGEPDLQADWRLDRSTLRSKKGSRSLEADMVSTAQRLLAKVEGICLSSSSHSSIFPGEKGFDNATGLGVNFAWGVASPPRGVVASNTGA